MKPIPVVFHIGPLQVHTYGIGLAAHLLVRVIATSPKRLRDHGVPDAWFAKSLHLDRHHVPIVGARAVHVVANLCTERRATSTTPGTCSLSGTVACPSYGGLLGRCAHRADLRLGLVPPAPLETLALDLIAPVLVIVWAMGRLLGPQLMYQGGGNLTHAWYGMAYAGQPGKRVPVPIIQAFEDSVVYVIALWVERRIARRGGPIGIVATTAVTLYGAARFNDEYVLLPHNTGGTSPSWSRSVAFVGVGAALAGWLLVEGQRTRPRRRRRSLVSAGRAELCRHSRRRRRPGSCRRCQRFIATGR